MPPTSEIKFPVSSDPTATFEFRLLEVDYEVRLYWQNTVVLGAKAHDTPKTAPLLRKRKYCVRYNNNDGGDGRLNFQVVQILNGVEQEILAVDNSAILGPRVIEIPFMLWPAT